METNNNVKQQISREGVNNPMYGRRHSAEARRKQSEAAKKRHQEYKKWKDCRQAHITMDEFLSSQSMKDYISSIIREEVSKLL